MTKVVRNNNEVVECNKSIDQIISLKMNYQGERYCRLEGEYNGYGYREWNILTTLTPTEIEYVLSRPESTKSGSKVWNSDMWIYYDEKEKRVYRGSGCGAAISFPMKSLSGL